MAEIVIDFGSTITGECTIEGYVGKVSVQSIGLPVTQDMEVNLNNATRLVHTVKVDNMSITKQVDQATIDLVKAITTGQNFPTVKVYLFRAGNDTTTGLMQVPFLQYTLENSMLASHEISADDGGNPTETLALNFTKVTWLYKIQDKAGTIAGNKTANFDLLLGKAAS
jgi:type VI secretion system secreted protein Hcp